MSKTPKEKLVEPVATQLTNYLKNGTINPSLVENQLQFKGVDQLQDYETIFKIHFVLSDEVVKFIEKLPRRIKRIKTEASKKVIRRQGEVRGKINWSKTLKAQTSSQDESLFVCQNPSKNYDVSENLVLKKLLSVVYEILENELEKPLEEDYEWLKNLKGKEDLVNYLKNIYRKNVHVDRIKDPREYDLSDRDISKAENSRKELYKEAASLLCKYMVLMEGNYTQDELEELLNETLILPGETPTLFELYCLFGFLKEIEKEQGEFQLRKIEKGSEQIAVLEKDDMKILVYHDSTGQMQFFEKIDNLRGEAVNNEFLERFRRASVKHADLIYELLNEKKSSFYGGRPDILVEYLEGGKIVKLAIGEVKYSDQKQTFSEGLKELIQYLYFARKSEKYSLDLEVQNSDLKGLFFIDKKSFGEKKQIITEIELPFALEIYDTNRVEKIFE